MASRQKEARATLEGFSLIEVIFVVALLLILYVLALPLATSRIQNARVSAAGRYLAGQLYLARSHALRRSVYVGLHFERDQSNYRYAFYADGNRNGVRRADIASGADKRISVVERLDSHFPSTAFGICGGVTDIDDGRPLGEGGDPIQIGRSDVLSLSPFGTATSGTLYVRGPGKQQVAVRILGASARVRVLTFDFETRRWR